MKSKQIGGGGSEKKLYYCFIIIIIIIKIFFFLSLYLAFVHFIQLAKYVIAVMVFQLLVCI